MNQPRSSQPRALDELLNCDDRALLGVETKAAGPDGSLPLSDEMLRSWPSGDLFGLTQGAAMGWSPDSSMLALGEGGVEAVSSGCEIVVLDTQTGDELFRFEGHLGGINTLIFSPDGNRLASASSDGTVIIWNLPARN